MAWQEIILLHCLNDDAPLNEHIERRLDTCPWKSDQNHYSLSEYNMYLRKREHTISLCNYHFAVVSAVMISSFHPKKIISVSCYYWKHVLINWFVHHVSSNVHLISWWLYRLSTREHSLSSSNNNNYENFAAKSKPFIYLMESWMIK